MNNGSAWLSDAQDEYVVTFSVQGRKLPSECKVGERYSWDSDDYTVTTITKAHYRGVEGELPFQYWDKEDVVFVDLMATSGKFATIDYSDEAPALYLGKAVEFEELNLKNLRKFEGWS
jgi:gentisate 1,2-dioxygenase